MSYKFRYRAHTYTHTAHTKHRTLASMHFQCSHWIMDGNSSIHLWYALSPMEWSRAADSIETVCARVNTAHIEHRRHTNTHPRSYLTLHTVCHSTINFFSFGQCRLSLFRLEFSILCEMQLSSWTRFFGWRWERIHVWLKLFYVRIICSSAADP